MGTDEAPIAMEVSISELREEDLRSSDKSEEPNVEQEKMDREYELRRFKTADANADGLLNETELAGMLFPESHGLLQVEGQQQLNHFDEDKDGFLSPSEFQGGDVEFERADSKKDGKLDLEELAVWIGGK